MPEDLDSATLHEVIDHFDRWLAYNQRYQRVPGIQAAVYAGDGIVFSASYGLADVENAVPLTDQHLFRIASHSKTFTATAVLQLVEQGRLRLDDKAGQHVTELVGTPLGERTVRELLAHSGGVTRDGADADWWQLAYSFPDRDQLLDVLRDTSSVVVAENERFKYSNIGYGLLGLVIEAAAGTSYNSYVQTAIVDKLGLAGIGPELDQARLGEYAAGYSSLEYAETRVPIEHIDTGALSAATGFFANARDLVTYFSAHLPGDDRLLSDKSKREMQHPHWVTGSDEKNRYGLGLGVSKIGEREVFGHAGGYPGHITRTSVDPERRLIVSVLTNAIDGPAAQLSEGFFRLVDVAELKERGDATGLDRFTGRYASLWGVLDISVLGGRLYATYPSGPNPADEPLALEADGDTLLVTGGSGFGSYGERYRFSFDDQGAVTSVRGAGGMRLHPLDGYTLPAKVVLR
jgi:CubicO group peptidase (beta-lactamase class C family)